MDKIEAITAKNGAASDTDVIGPSISNSMQLLP